MNHKIVIFTLIPVIILVILFGCEKAPTQEEIEAEKASQQRSNIITNNFLNEEIYLISIKYQFDIEMLVKAIKEYDKMTGGFSLFYWEAETNDFAEEEPDAIEILTVQEAIMILSQKYQIQEKVLASILIDMQSMESCSE